MIVTRPKEALAHYVEQHCPTLKFEEPYQAVGSVTDGKLTAALIFQSKTDHDVEISVAATHLPRALLKAVGYYVVKQMGCRRATFRTRSDNHEAIEAMKRLGAKEEGRQRGFFGDADAVVFGILKDEYVYGN